MEDENDEERSRAGNPPLDRRGRIRRVLFRVGLGMVFLLFVFSLWKDFLDARIWDAYDPESVLEASIRSERVEGSLRRQDLEFNGIDGLRVPTLFMLPRDPGEEPLPCVILLHGIGNRKELLDDIGPLLADARFASACFDQFGRGERKQGDRGAVRKALDLRRRVQLTVLETRRLVDYLVTRPEIDPDRIYVLGGSFGAMTGCMATSLDSRIQAAALAYGGGDYFQFRHSDEGREELGAWITPASALLDWLLATADPIDYVGTITPRPLLLQGGSDDRLLPVEAARALAEAAHDPKTVRWYEGGHLDKDEQLLRRVLEDAILWLRDTDARLSADSEFRKR